MTRRPYPAPRWQTPLPAGVDGSYGPEVALAFEELLGIRLDRWQRRALNRALATAGGSLVHRQYLVSTSRQCGKTVAIRALIEWALTSLAVPSSWATVLGLAFDKRQARIPYRAVKADLAPLARRLGPAARGGLTVTEYLGIRSGIAGRSRSYDVASREAASAIRGESVDLALFDEVRTHRGFDTWAALLPTTAARPEPLVVLTSSAGDVRSVVLRFLFDRGLRIIDGAEPAEGFGMTWYAAPDELAPDDPAAWWHSTPALADGRITEATIRGELYSLTDAAFRAERLNLWVDELGAAWLPAGVWTRTAGGQPIGPYVGDRIVLGVEAVPSWRRASITVAIARGDELWLGIAADLDASSRSSATIAPSELIAELERVAEQWRPATVAYSGAAAAAPHVKAWAEASDVAAIALTGGQLRSASELFRSELVGDRAHHADDPLLLAQFRASRPSAPVESGSWYISLRASLGEVDAIRAIAWAAWAAIAPEAREAEPQVF